MLTLADIDRMKALMHEHAVKPARITTYAQLRKMRRQAKLLGLKHRWRIGDYYYTLLQYQRPPLLVRL